MNTNETEDLKQKLQDLQKALKNKSISVNEYCSMYHATSQQIKRKDQALNQVSNNKTERS